MKLNKTLALAALMAGGLFAASTLQAQDSTNTPPAGEHHGGPGGPGGMRGRPNADMMAKELGLTDDQKTQVKAALEDMQSKMKALHDDTSASPEDKKAKFKEIRDANQAKMKEILTPEQFTKLQSHMPKGRGPGGDKKAPGADAPPKE
jgi:Spy/CpxP family protein refolding chaperone